MDLNLCQNSVVVLSLNINRDSDLTYSFFNLYTKLEEDFCFSFG